VHRVAGGARDIQEQQDCQVAPTRAAAAHVPNLGARTRGLAFIPR
jgi:hypothetical protein